MSMIDDDIDQGMRTLIRVMETKEHCRNAVRRAQAARGEYRMVTPRRSDPLTPEDRMVFEQHGLGFRPRRTLSGMLVNLDRQSGWKRLWQAIRGKPHLD